MTPTEQEQYLKYNEYSLKKNSKRGEVTDYTLRTYYKAEVIKVEQYLSE